MQFREFILLEEINLRNIAGASLEQLEGWLKILKVKMQNPRLTGLQRDELNQNYEYVWRAFKNKQKNPTGATIVPTGIGVQKAEPAFPPAKPTFRDNLHTWSLYYQSHPEEMTSAVDEIKKQQVRLVQVGKQSESMRLNNYLSLLRRIQRRAS
jgi:hypothetical protein